MSSFRGSFLHRSSLLLLVSFTGRQFDTRRSSVPSVSTLAAILPLHDLRFLLSPNWCEGRDSNPHASRRQLLRLVRLPIPPPSPPYADKKRAKNNVLYLRCLFEFNPDGGRTLRKLPGRVAAAARAAAPARRDHLPLRPQRG